MLRGESGGSPSRKPLRNATLPAVSVITDLFIFPTHEKDKKRAKELDFSPTGDITIQGMKNDFSWESGFRTEVDCTKGCIVVTDEEIEEIERLAPDGTIAKIRLWEAA